MTDSHTSTLEVPGAVLTYDVRAAATATDARQVTGRAATTNTAGV